MINDHIRSNNLDRSRHDGAVGAVISKIGRSIDSLPAALKEEHEPQLRRAAASAKAASAYDDVRWIRSIATAARAKAKKLEDAATAARFAKWKETLSQGPGGALGKTPTRKAYR